MVETESPIPRSVLLALGCWLLVALLLGATGIFSRFRPPFPQVTLFALVLTLLLLFWKVTPFRKWALSVDLRVLVALHVGRFVGIYFLALYRRGDLPYAFAVPGGWGDILVASTAIICLIILSHGGASRRPALWLWNTLGMLDILGVVLTAARLGAAEPQSMAALLRLPLSLLPTFLVPLIILTHIVIFMRLWKRSEAEKSRRQILFVVLACGGGDFLQARREVHSEVPSGEIASSEEG